MCGRLKKKLGFTHNEFLEFRMETRENWLMGEKNQKKKKSWQINITYKVWADWLSWKLVKKHYVKNIRRHDE